MLIMESLVLQGTGAQSIQGKEKMLTKPLEA